MVRTDSSFPDDYTSTETPQLDIPLKESDSDHSQKSEQHIMGNGESDSEISDQSSTDAEELTNNAAESLKIDETPIRMIQDVLMKKDLEITSLRKQPAPSFKTAFVEEEADVEEDEYMNFGGADGEIDAKLDCYDQEFVGEADKEIVENHDDIIELHR